MTKACSKCGEAYPATLEFFGKRTRNKSGLRAECKSCQAKQNKVWYSENRPEILEVHAKRRENNREYLRNKSTQWQICNRERASANAKAWRQRNKEHYLEVTRKYREKNRPLRSQYAQNRIARVHLLPATLTSGQWDAIMGEFGNVCAYCGSVESLQQDHVIPVTKGGGYTPDNIIPACKSCNCSKGNKDLKEWYPEQSFYSAEREDTILRAVGRNAIQRSESS